MSLSRTDNLLIIWRKYLNSDTICKNVKIKFCNDTIKLYLSLSYLTNDENLILELIKIFIRKNKIENLSWKQYGF